jgi:hypothetical protein
MRATLEGSVNHTVKSSVVGLDVSLSHFAVLDDKSVALATGIAEDGGTVERQVKGRCELAVRVGKEANARLAGGVLRGTPGAHAGSMSVMSQGRGYQVRFGYMAKRFRSAKMPSSDCELEKVYLAVASTTPYQIDLRCRHLGDCS